MVKIPVKVKPNSKQNLVEPANEGRYIIVRVKAKAVEGMANAAVITLLSDHFKVPKNRISIIKGFKSRNKLIEIESSS